MTAGSIAYHGTLGLVRILLVDSDHRALVWVVTLANPDKDMMVARGELCAEPKA